MSTAEKTTDAGSSEAGTGRVVRVTGPVVDVEFPADQVPQLFNALTVDVELEALRKTMTLEVALHLGDNTVRAIAMQPADGLVRGAPVTDTGAAISVPVGDQVKGHVFNMLGECLDSPDTEFSGDRWEIHRDPPPFDKLEGKTDRQKNPHPKGSLAYATWVCARLGGWTGYYGKPGPVVLPQGWLELQTVKRPIHKLDLSLNV